jgi:hypothetical protein
MAEIKELTFSEIAEHNTKKDLYLIVHDKVYDCTSFVDEHPYVFPNSTCSHRIFKSSGYYLSIRSISCRVGVRERKKNATSANFLSIPIALS